METTRILIVEGNPEPPSPLEASVRGGEEEFVARFFEDNALPALVFDPTGRLVRWNRACRALFPDPVAREALASRLALGDTGVTPLSEHARGAQHTEIAPFAWNLGNADQESDRRYFRGTAFPLALSGDSPPHLCAVLQDVTAEETARRERDSHSALSLQWLDAADAAVFFVGADRTVRFANRRSTDFFGPETRGLVGEPVERLVQELACRVRQPGEFAARCRKLYSDPLVESDDDIELLPPGPVHLRRKTSPVRDGSGQTLGRLEVYLDETDLVQHRRLLAAQNRELDAYASRLAHDLKTPLVSLRGFLDLLHRQHGPSLDTRGAMYLDKVRSSAAIVGEMVDGLRRLVAVGDELSPGASLAPLPVLQRVADELAEEAAQRGVALVLPSEAPLVRCDQTTLFQLLQNLLANAVHHSDPDKEARWVRVEIEQCGGEVEIRLLDNGVGLEPEELPEVFLPFRRGQRAGKPGLGLGLTISRRLAQICSGRIEASSRPGAGSTFCLFLPAPP